jgi:hypothetical protein
MPLHDSVAPFRGFFPPERRRRFPIVPIIFWPGFFGLGYNAFWFPNCNGFLGWGYGCGAFTLYDGYAPEPVSPPDGNPPAENFAADNFSADNLGEEGGIGVQLPQTFLLYLKDGSVFAISGYTVSDGKLHYKTGYGDQNDIDLNLLDLQKTIDENAQRGVTFTLTPPNPGPAAPGPIAPPGQ